MPFGLKDAPQIFQRKMDEVFINYKDFTCIYIDNILVFSKNRDEHTQHLKKIFDIVDIQFRDSWVSMRQRTPMMRKL